MSRRMLYNLKIDGEDNYNPNEDSSQQIASVQGVTKELWKNLIGFFTLRRDRQGESKIWFKAFQIMREMAEVNEWIFHFSLY